MRKEKVPFRRLRRFFKNVQKQTFTIFFFLAKTSTSISTIRHLCVGAIVRNCIRYQYFSYMTGGKWCVQLNALLQMSFKNILPLQLLLNCEGEKSGIREILI